METMFEEDIEIEKSSFPLPERKLSDGDKDVLVIIMLEKNPAFKGFIKPYELTMCGKKMWEWVALAADGYEVKTTACTCESDILSLIKPLLGEHKTTVVLYCDTPLLQKSTLREIVSFFNAKCMNAMKLTRGYVFDTEYIKNATNIVSTQTQYFNEEDFITVYDLKQLNFVNDILRMRILDFHLHNGVFIESNNVFIDADVVIESGVKIFGNNIIKGKSFIGKNCVLEGGNYIENSIISDGCRLVQSHVVSSRISENMIVGPFEKVIKKSI